MLINRQPAARCRKARSPVEGTIARLPGSSCYPRFFFLILFVEPISPYIPAWPSGISFVESLYCLSPHKEVLEPFALFVLVHNWSQAPFKPTFIHTAVHRDPDVASKLGHACELLRSLIVAFVCHYRPLGCHFRAETMAVRLVSTRTLHVNIICPIALFAASFIDIVVAQLLYFPPYLSISSLPNCSTFHFIRQYDHCLN